ncbi:transposase [Escherichia coli]|uniref:transposase n=1 Tax=Escherichia coli TaxID=562 RepID=UPI000E073DC8|nr:transposase [Escherichia coli]STJ89113.1 transposase [Escherichia coli]
MTKTVSTSKKTRKQHSPEFRSEALKLAERIGVTAAARELSLYESQLYNWRSKQQNQQTSSERELGDVYRDCTSQTPAGRTG